MDTYERAIDRVNDAYMSEDYDKYEELIERYTKRFGYDYNQFEDACTCARMFGHGISYATENHRTIGAEYSRRYLMGVFRLFLCPKNCGDFVNEQMFCCAITEIVLRDTENLTSSQDF